VDQIPPIPPLPAEIPPPPFLFPLAGALAGLKCWYRLSGPDKVLLRPITDCCQLPAQAGDGGPVCPGCGERQRHAAVDYEVRPRREFSFELDGV
jgi:hypothetical protein